MHTPPSPGIGKLIVSFVILLVVAGLLFFVSRNYNKKTLPPGSNGQTKELNNVEHSPIGQLPSKFPKDFPVEVGAKVDDGYNVSSPENFQSTIHFESKESLDKNFKIYTDYLSSKNGWIVENVLDTPTVKSIFAKNALGTTVLVNIAQNVTTKVSQVTISFVYANRAGD